VPSVAYVVFVFLRKSFILTQTNGKLGLAMVHACRQAWLVGWWPSFEAGLVGWLVAIVRASVRGWLAVT